MQSERIYRWRRLDQPGLEVLRVGRERGRIVGRSTVLDAGPEPFGLRYTWMLDADWRTRSLLLQLDDSTERTMLIERSGAAAWRVDGAERADLAGCDEIDVSITPFCNSLALRRIGPLTPGAGAEITALYVELPRLTLVPSRQRYERIARREVEYVDLGAAAGFRARLALDSDGFVVRYAGLFELVERGD